MLMSATNNTGRFRLASRAALFLIMILSAASAAASDHFAELRQNAAAIESIQADFTQKKLMKILSKPLVSEGRFAYAAPDSVRWEYLRPLQSVVLSHRGETRRFLAAGGKMVEDTSGGVKAMSIVLGEVSGWMQGRFEDNPSFTASIHRKQDQTFVILTPATESLGRMMRQIEIVLSRRDATIRSVRLVESADAETVIEFKNVRVNAELPAGLFQDVQ